MVDDGMTPGGATDRTMAYIKNVQNYPLAFSVDYPERLSRLKTAFRLILVIPILVVLVVLIGPEDIGRVGGLTATWEVEPHF